MRIPNLTLNGSLVSRLNTLNTKQNQLNQELASGQRITHASEDPQAANRIMRLRSEQRSVQVYAKNSDRALSISQASFAALDHLKSLSDRAAELATLSNSSTVSPKERQAYAVELNEIIKQAVDSGNTKYQGEYLFNGTNTDSAPFADDGTATPAALTTAPSAPAALPVSTTTAGSATVSVVDANAVSVGMVVSGPGIPTGATIESVDLIANTFTMSVNATASGTVNLTAAKDGPAIQLSDTLTISPFTTGAGNSKVATFITRLIALRDGLNNTAAAADGGTAAITAARANLLSSEDDLVAVIADNAALQTRMESLKSQAESRFNDMQSLISKDADVDVAQTMVNLTQARTSYQAALQAGAEMMKLSLLNYLP